MKKSTAISIVVMNILLIIALYAVSVRTNRLKKDRDLQKQNVEALMMDVHNYRTKDSLQAATVKQLEISLSTYMEYRQEDAAIIENLRVDNNRLKGVITTHTESYYKHTVALRDSVQVLAGARGTPAPVKTKLASFKDEWHSLNLKVFPDSISYELRNRESLIIVNHVIPKRFLGFMWKYGVREIRTEATSRNPYTTKIDIESITIL